MKKAEEDLAKAEEEYNLEIQRLDKHVVKSSDLPTIILVHIKAFSGWKIILPLLFNHRETAQQSLFLRYEMEKGQVVKEEIGQA